MNGIVRRVRVLARVAVVAGMVSLTGCLAAAVGAGAGAVGAIAYTQRGASSLVDGGLANVFARSQAAFQQMQVTQTGESTEDSGSKRKLQGKAGNLDVTIEMSQKSNTTTQVEVYARRNAVEWDKEFAKNLLSRIVTQ